MKRSIMSLIFVSLACHQGWSEPNNHPIDRTLPSSTVANDRGRIESGKPTKLVNAKRLTEQDWKDRLTPLQFKILREKGTESRGGPLLFEKRKGVFFCAGCGAALYRSEHKFRSGTGWPSFTQAVPGAVLRVPDHSHGMNRTELVCGHCNGHLGHVFDDGPQPTGERHCINSASLQFVPSDSSQ